MLHMHVCTLARGHQDKVVSLNLHLVVIKNMTYFLQFVIMQGRNTIKCTFHICMCITLHSVKVQVLIYFIFLLNYQWHSGTELIALINVNQREQSTTVSIFNLFCESKGSEFTQAFLRHKLAAKLHFIKMTQYTVTLHDTYTYLDNEI